jgi:hypothetical protein
MAQTFSVITALIDTVGSMTQARAKRKQDLKAERDRLLEEVPIPTLTKMNILKLMTTVGRAP